MKTVLCFGDSNTWGAKPMRSIDNIERFDELNRANRDANRWGRTE